MAVKHSNLISEILIALSHRDDIRVWRNETGAVRKGAGMIRYGLIGSPDIIGIMGPNGKWLGIECKVGKDIQREAQKNFEEMIASRGGIYIVAYNVSDVLDRI